MEAKLLKNSLADSEHILLAIMKVKNNSAFHLLESSNVTYDKIIEQLTLQPDIHAGLGFSEDEDEEEDEIQNQPSTGNSQSGATQQTRSTQRNLLMIHLYSIISVQI